MLKNRALATGLTLMFLVLMLASLSARFWAVDRAWQKTGPTHLAADSEQVVLYAGGDLFQFTADGKLLRRISSFETGLDEGPIDLRINPDGRLLVAEQQPARIRLCDIGNWDCNEIGSAVYPHLSRQFKVLPASPGFELLVTDARGDRLWGMPPDQQEPLLLSTAGMLAGPNDLALDRQGSLWIADTDHRRIVELRFSDNGDLEPGRQHAAQNHLTVGERYYPMMLAEAPDGLWWVVQAADFSDGTADLVVYHPDEGVNTRIELPGSTYPTDIASSGKNMLITDLEQFRVYQTDTQLYEVSDFGDAEFRSLMSEWKGNRNHYLRISTLALVGVILFGGLMIASALKSTPRNKRWTQTTPAIDFSQAGDSPPQVSGIHWLTREARADRSLKWADRLTFILPLTLLVGMLGVYGLALSLAGSVPDDQVQEKLDDLGLLLLLGGIIITGLIPVTRLALRPMKNQLGTDGRRLFVRLYDGRELAVAPSEVAYTGNAVFHSRFSVSLQARNGQKIYEQEELRQWVLPLLKEAEEISQAQVFIRQWKQRDDLLLWSVIAGVALGLLLILVSLGA